MPQCIINGCTNEGIHNFGVRCRRPNTSAIWAPNTEAYLCNQHAEQGCVIEVNIIPTTTETVTTRISGGGLVAERTTDIAHDADE